MIAGETPATVLELGLGLLLLVAVVLFHGVCLRKINRAFSRAWSRVTPRTPMWRTNLVITVVVGALVTLHLVEPLIFAVPLAAAGILPSLRDSYYYVLESYTTLGETAMRLPEDWRLVGPMISMAGLFTFGWTGSALVTIMSEVAKLDVRQAKAETSRQAAAEPRKLEPAE
jgi:hypothetical protein